MKRAKPVHVSRCGNVSVKVLRNGRGLAIAWREYAGAPRRRESFTSKAAAVARADEIAKALADGQAESVKLTGADRESYRRAVLVLRPLGLPLHVAAEEYVSARAALPPGVTLHQAAEQARGRADDLPAAAVLLEEMVAELAAHPHRPRSLKRIAELRNRLGRFVRAFPDLQTPGREDIERYLLALGGAAKSHDHHLGAIVQLYRYAARRGWPTARPLPAAGLVRYYEPGEPATFTPAVLREVLAKLSPPWIPWVTIGALAGLRPTEIFRLRWEHFRWSERVIAVPAAVAAKVRRPRLVPIADSLAAWLAPWRQNMGMLYPGSMKGRQNAQGRELARLREAIPGLTWVPDVLRHSFGSYRLAVTQNMAQVAIEMGTSETMLRRHYNNPATVEAAQEWFAIAPDPAACVPLVRASV